MYSPTLHFTHTHTQEEALAILHLNPDFGRAELSVHDCEQLVASARQQQNGDATASTAGQEGPSPDQLRAWITSSKVRLGEWIVMRDEGRV